MQHRGVGIVADGPDCILLPGLCHSILIKRQAGRGGEAVKCRTIVLIVCVLGWLASETIESFVLLCESPAIRVTQKLRKSNEERIVWPGAMLPRCQAWA